MSTAKVDANWLLSLAWYPAGAQRLPTWIHLKGFDLSQAGASIGDPDQVDIARFYLAGPKSQGLSWLNARTPRGGTLEGYGGPGRANLEWSYSFSSSPILAQSDLQYAKRILPDGDVEFRIDAQVAWTPQKSRFSIIPSGATLVEAEYSPGGEQTRPVQRRLTASSTSVATIATIRRQIDALPVAYPGVVSCPYQGTGSVTVRFFKGPHVRAYAMVFFSSNSCGEVWVKQYSTSHQLLGTGDDGGGYGDVPSVMKFLGIKSPI